MITPDRLASWRRTAALDSRTGQPVGDALLDACKEIEELQAKLDKDHDELRDKRTDLLNIRGVLSPQGRSLGLGPVVPMPLGKDVVPAVEWLAAERDTLELRLEDRTAERDLARDLAAAYEGQLAEIERLAYMGGQSAHSTRRSILRVFEEAGL